MSFLCNVVSSRTVSSCCRMRPTVSTRAIKSSIREESLIHPNVTKYLQMSCRSSSMVAFSQPVVNGGIDRCSISSRNNYERRCFSSMLPPGTSDESLEALRKTKAYPIEATPPESLTYEMAKGILEMTNFYVHHGFSNKRFKAIGKNTEMKLLPKWQQMMEVYIITQAHVISGMGYNPTEEGLNLFAEQLGKCTSNVDSAKQESLQRIRRQTWRAIVGITFNVDSKDIPVLTIVQARDIMHQVSSRMIEPDTLFEIHQKASVIVMEEPELEFMKRHEIIQDIIINRVYLGRKDNKPSLVERFGFGNDESGYAKLQCSMTEYENDPLIAQYGQNAMAQIWKAAGLQTEQAKD